MRFRKGRTRRRRIALFAVVAMFVLVFVLFDQLVTFAPGGRRKDTPPVQVDDAIGATLEPLDRGTARTLDVGPATDGLVVTSLSTNGPAASAGIRAGDVVEKIDSTPISSIKEAAAVIRQSGRDVSLTLHRDHHYATVLVRTRPAGESRRIDEGER